MPTLRALQRGLPAAPSAACTTCATACLATAFASPSGWPPARTCPPTACTPLCCRLFSPPAGWTYALVNVSWRGHTVVAGYVAFWRRYFTAGWRTAFVNVNTVYYAAVRAIQRTRPAYYYVRALMPAALLYVFTYLLIYYCTALHCLPSAVPSSTPAFTRTLSRLSRAIRGSGHFACARMPRAYTLRNFCSSIYRAAAVVRAPQFLWTFANLPGNLPAHSQRLTHTIAPCCHPFTCKRGLVLI